MPVTMVLRPTPRSLLEPRATPMEQPPEVTTVVLATGGRAHGHPSASILNVLPCDIFDHVLSGLACEGSFTALLTVSHTCRTIRAAAETVLRAVSPSDLVLAMDQLPLDTRSVVEVRAAHSLRRGSLTHDATAILLDRANTMLLSSQPGSWRISSAADGDDPGQDFAYGLRRFESVPCSTAKFGAGDVRAKASTTVSKWYEEHCPDLPLQLDLPCVIVGPPRFLTLAGSTKQCRQYVSSVPMELCHVVVGPTNGLIGALLPGYASESQ